jgi:hypothetical protein
MKVHKQEKNADSEKLVTYVHMTTYITVNQILCPLKIHTWKHQNSLTPKVMVFGGSVFGG